MINVVQDESFLDKHYCEESLENFNAEFII